MSSVRVLVGTRKGAFILTADGKRDRWTISEPQFGGWEMYHLKGSPVNPDRLYASQGSGWFGQLMQRSDDGGKTWEPVGNKFEYASVPGTHQWYDGTPHPWEFKRVWHLEPSLTDPDTVYAGVEDAAMFKTTDGGADLARAAGPARARLRLALAARRRRHVPAHDRARSRPTRSACSSRSPPPARSAPTMAARAGSRSTRGCARRTFPIRRPTSATACTASRCTRRARRRCSCRSTGTSCAATMPATRGARSAATCRPTSGSRSTCTRTSPRRSTSCRSRATPSTIRPTASCACIAAAPAATSGRR